MKIILTEAINGNLVAFESDLGHGLALWGSNDTILNKPYNVELEIDDLFVWDDNITLENKHNFDIKLDNNLMTFRTKVLSCADDGVLVMELGREDIVMIETSQTREIASSCVSFVTNPTNVTLYPIKL